MIKRVPTKFSAKKLEVAPLSGYQSCMDEQSYILYLWDLTPIVVVEPHTFVKE